MSAFYKWVHLPDVAAVGLLGLVITTGCAPLYIADRVDMPETPRPPHLSKSRVMLSLPPDMYSILLQSTPDWPPGITEGAHREEVTRVIRRVTEESSLFHLSPASEQPEKVSEVDYVMVVRFLVEQNIDRPFLGLMGALGCAATLCIVPLWMPYDVYLSAQVIDQKTQRSRYYTVKGTIDSFLQIPLFMIVPLHRSWSASRALGIVAEQLTRKLHADMQQDGLF